MELPLPIGGEHHNGIILPGVPKEQLSAFIAVTDEHAYIQPVTSDQAVFHNDERLTDSAWLKSGDRIQIGNALVSWKVHGEKILIDVSRQSDIHQLHPPPQPPPDQLPSGSDELPVRAQEMIRPDRRKRFRRLAIAFTGLLLLTAIYLLSATSVVIRVDPEAAELKLKGFPPPLVLWGSRLVLPGHYAVEAVYPGYEMLQEEVDIKMGGVTDLSYTLMELPGVLKFVVTPKEIAHWNKNIRLYIDDVETAVGTDGKVEIPGGDYRIRIETERYLTHKQQITIQGIGKVQLLDVNLQPAWASVSVSSDPAGAEVSVDDTVMGQTPLVTEILQGRREIRLIKRGFKPSSIMQSFEAGSELTLQTVQLQPVDGKLSVTSVPEGASVTLGGLFQGTTPVVLNLPANKPHTLRLSKSGYQPVTQTVSLKSDEASAIKLELEPQHGTIFLTIKPADATLKIDGQKSDQGSGRLQLSVQQHRLTISKPGHATETLLVTPRQGISQKFEVVLKTIEQQKKQEKSLLTPETITTRAGQQLQIVKPDSPFTMGASRREAGRRANESRRLVQLNRHFYFARNEVTNREYRLFRASHNSAKFDGAGLNGDSQPVVNLDWNDAARYCNWLSEQQGLPKAYIEDNDKMVAVNPATTGYRLPMEAEWAWVARKLGHPSEQRYPWQGTYPPLVASGNYADARIADTLADTVPGYDDGYRGTAPVASFPASPAGFYDLGGNVAEWIHDYYDVYPGDATRLAIDPSGPQTGEHHVVRGSGWRHGNITELRLSYRDYSKKPRYDLGFRIARYVE